MPPQFLQPSCGSRLRPERSGWRCEAVWIPDSGRFFEDSAFSYTVIADSETGH